MADTCFLCGQPATRACKKCSAGIYFCNRNHEKYHYLNNTCLPFKILESAEKGRYMVATRDIQPLEKIMEEDASLFATKLEQPPVCLECWKVTDEDCEKCGLPLCTYCSTNQKNHPTECEVVRKGGRVSRADLQANPEIMASVAPIRMLGLKRRKPEAVERTFALIDMCDVLKKKPKWKMFEKVVSFIRERCSSQLGEKDILQALGIFNCNGCSVSGFQARAIFPVFCMINHSCASNASNIVNSDEEKMEVISQALIKKGQEINIRYTSDSIMSVNQRQSALRDTWLFECNCDLCTDPTERNSFMSAICCQKCKADHLLPTRLSGQYQWKCQNCPNTLTEDEVNGIESKVETLFRKIASGPTNIKKQESFWKMCQSILHKNHAISMKVRMELINSIDSNTPSYNIREHMNDVKSFLAVMQKINPEYSRRRSKLLYLMCRLELINLLKDVQAGQVCSAAGKECVGVNLGRLESAIAGATCDPSYLNSSENASLAQRIKKLITPRDVPEADIGDGIRMVLTVLLKLPFVK